MSGKPITLRDRLAGNPPIGALITSRQCRELARGLRDVAAYAHFLGQDERSDTLWATALLLATLADEEDVIDISDSEE